MVDVAYLRLVELPCACEKGIALGARRIRLGAVLLAWAAERQSRHAMRPDERAAIWKTIIGSFSLRLKDARLAVEAIQTSQRAYLLMPDER